MAAQQRRLKHTGMNLPAVQLDFLGPRGNPAGCHLLATLAAPQPGVFW